MDVQTMCNYLDVLRAACRLASRFRRDERGSYLIITALMAPVLIGFVGLAADYGLWTQKQRAMQNAADSGATSAALAFATGNTNTATQGKAVASSYGFVDGTNNVSVTVNRPPASGSYTSNSSAVEVIISGDRTPYFSTIFSSSTGTMSARAVGLGSSNGTGCVLALDTMADGADTETGNTAVNLNGCSLYDNSTSSTALRIVGAATLSAKSVNVVGGISGTSAITTTDGVLTGQAAAADPYAGISMPSASGTTNTSCCSDGTYSPGIYKGGMKLTGHTDITLNPGTYYLQGDLDVSGGSTISGTGVTLVFTSSNGSTYAGATINGGANVTLTAPTSGTFAGVAMFGDRSMDQGHTFKFNGGSTQNITGAIYIPKGNVEYAGGSTSNTTNKCTQLIADTITFKGNANFNNTCTGVGTSTISTVTASLVE